MNGIDQITTANHFMHIKAVEKNDKSTFQQTEILKRSPDEQREFQEEELKAGQQQLNKLTDKLSVNKEEELSLNEKLEVQRLQQVDRSVREHEQAHMRAARDLALSGPNFQYERGPDGKKYVVHGEVNIDSDIATLETEEAIEKAAKIQNAALAPSDPSPKDMRAAVQARIIESKAHRKLSREEQLDVMMSQKEKRSEEPNKPPDIAEEAINELGLNQYKNNLEFQKNLSSMLDLFT